MSSILITGCSTGIGFVLARHACERGHHVVASMREPAGRNTQHAASLRDACADQPGRLDIIELDVTDDASVAAAAAQTFELVGELDVVVHNAGVGCLGLMESFTTAQLQQAFDVNVFGSHRLNRALLPRMRKRGQGWVVFVSSSIGRIMLPYFAAYGPSKFAVEGLAECYAQDLRPQGLDVTVVQSGGFATQFFPNALRPGDPACVESYGDIGARAENFWLSVEFPPLPPTELLSGEVLRVLELPPGKRPLRLVVDPLMGQGLTAINETIGTIQAQVLGGMGIA